MTGQRIWYHHGNRKGKDVMSEEKPKRKYTMSDKARKARQETVRKAYTASIKSKREKSWGGEVVTVGVPVKLRDEIDSIAERTGVARWKVIKRAIALLKKHGYEAKLEARKKPAG